MSVSEEETSGASPLDAATEREGELRSQAWLLRGITGSTEGLLELHDGRLSFTMTGVYYGMPGTRGDKRGDETGRVFEAPLAEVSEVKFPWYSFGLLVKFNVRNDSYRVSFMRPGNTTLGTTKDAVNMMKGSTWRTAKRWKQILKP